MNFLKSIFQPTKKAISSYEHFWNWFKTHEGYFHQIVKNYKTVESLEENFFNKLSPKLNELKEGIFFLTGMKDDNTVELVFTPDGNIRNVIFVEELVASAPEINGWMFTALKQPVENIGISMGDYKFTTENIHFYSVDHPNYPDEIDIRVVHDDFDDDNSRLIRNGTSIFLDNLIGELNFLTAIDHVEVISRAEATQELVPIEKLLPFIKWRKKEFIEKYQDEWYKTEDDAFNLLEATLKSGAPLIALVNKSVLQWEGKASHPWIATLQIEYNTDQESGLPDKEVSEQMNTLEDGIEEQLEKYNGHLFVGRQTWEGKREIYYACKDFRQISKVYHIIQQGYQDIFEIEIDIYKDKYWQSFERFMPK